jgi:hypothetical protein
MRRLCMISYPSVAITWVSHRSGQGDSIHRHMDLFGLETARGSMQVDEIPRDVVQHWNTRLDKLPYRTFHMAVYTYIYHPSILVLSLHASR